MFVCSDTRDALHSVVLRLEAELLAELAAANQRRLLEYAMRLQVLAAEVALMEVICASFLSCGWQLCSLQP